MPFLFQWMAFLYLKRKKHLTKNFDLYLHMPLKFEIISTRILSCFLTHALYVCMYIYIYIYIYIYVGMVDFGESNEMIKISGKVDKLNTYNGFSDKISLFVNSLSLLWWSSFVNKELNIATEPIVSVWFIHFST